MTSGATSTADVSTRSGSANAGAGAGPGTGHATLAFATFRAHGNVGHRHAGTCRLMHRRWVGRVNWAALELARLRA